MGLPKSGKTTLARELAPLLGAVVFDGDETRQRLYPDLTFSIEARLAQARRMGWLCDQVTQAGHYAIAAFICPTQATRTAFGACFTIFLNTRMFSQYPDTNRLFEVPDQPDHTILNWDHLSPREAAWHIRDILLGTKPKSLFIGRFQPLHAGHIKMIQKVLDEGRKVVVALRDTVLGPDNPFSLSERRKMFTDTFGSQVQVISVPDVDEVCHGRDVGWKIREIRLPAEIEAIRASHIRGTQPVGPDS